MDPNKAFLGRGWGFPPTFDKTTRGVVMLEEEKDIESSLEILLSTRLGERIMVPKYGCNLDDMVFEAMNLTMITYLKDLVENAILYYEPRINLEGLDIDTSGALEGVLLINIDFTVRTTNSRFNYVYPFYMKEGTSIPVNR